MKKTVLVIGLGWEQEPLIEKLIEFNYSLIGIHYNNDYNKNISYKKVFVNDFWEIKEVLQFCETVKFDAVISDQDDYGHFLQSLIAEKYNLPGPKIQQAQFSLNKYLQRKQALLHKIKIPNFKLVISPNNILEFVKENDYPVILKPVDNRGSIGVVKITKDTDIFKAYQLAIENSHSHLLLVEKFIEGIEYTVDGFCFPEPKSLAIAEKRKIDSKRQVSVDIKYPAELKPKIYNEVLENNKKVANAMGYKFGFIHAEYIITQNNEIYLVEIANRGGGCFTSEIILPNVTDIPVLDYYINMCLGHKIDNDNIIIQKNEVLLKFFNFNNGLIKKIKGVSDLKNNKKVLQYHFFVKEGSEINNMTSDADRHGFVIVKNENVREYSNKIIEKITIEYK